MPSSPPTTPPPGCHSGAECAGAGRESGHFRPDADLAGVKRIIAGTQTMTVYKPITELANTAAEIAVELGNGKQPKADATLNNGLKDVRTPAHAN